MTGTSLRASAVALALLAGCSPAPADKPVAREKAALADLQAPSPAVAPIPLTPVGQDLPQPEPALAKVEKIPVSAPAVAHTPVPGPLMPEDLPPGDGATDPSPFPEAVTDFMVERDGCDHFRAEEAYDEDRRIFLEDSIRQLCTGTDARLAELRRRYVDNPDVTAALSPYEARIEGEGAGMP